jgi:hypothetical protein
MRRQMAGLAAAQAALTTYGAPVAAVQPQYHPYAVYSTSGAATAGAPTQQQQLQYGAQQYGPYGVIPAAPAGFRLPGRLHFPCDACGVKGHWREDGLYKPEEVHRHIQNLNLRLAQDLLGLPAPALQQQPGSSGRMFIIILDAQDYYFILLVNLLSFSLHNLPVSILISDLSL